MEVDTAFAGPNQVMEKLFFPGQDPADAFGFEFWIGCSHGCVEPSRCISASEHFSPPGPFPKEYSEPGDP